jgi:DNA end-binding protein Ku
MPGSHWKGVISFGLVTIPIVLYPSRNKQADISFHQIDKRDNARIQYQRINSNTGKIVPWEEITRGYEFDKETIIPVPDEVLQKVAGDKAKAINIDTFIDRKDLNLLTLENVYYLVPDKNGQKGYVILRDSLTDTNKVGIAKVVISTKEYLSALIPHKDALLLCLLKYDNEMKKPSEFDLPNKNISAYKITAKEIEVAKQLIKSMSSKWKPEHYVDDYQQSIHQWVEESVNHLPHNKTVKSSRKATNIINFVDLLKKSLAASSKRKNSKTVGHIPSKVHKLNKLNKVNKHKNKSFHKTTH